MTERELHDRLKSECAHLCGPRIYLGDSVVTLEQEGYPALYCYHVNDKAKGEGTQHGVRQIVTAHYGVYCVADRERYSVLEDDLAQLRATVRGALVGHKFAGCLTPMRLVEGYRVKADAQAAIWLDLFAVDDLMVGEDAA